jgi:hypothetical protein
MIKNFNNGFLYRYMGSFCRQTPFFQSSSHRGAALDAGHDIGFQIYWGTGIFSYSENVELGRLGNPNAEKFEEGIACQLPSHSVCVL